MKPKPQLSSALCDAQPPATRSRRQTAATMLKVAAVLFVAEFAAMCLLPPVGVHKLRLVLADGLILAVLALPALYAIGFFPSMPVEVEQPSRYTRLERQMMILLATYVAMVMVAVGVFGLLASGQEFGSKVINVAGRQRMLSQRLVKAAMFEAMDAAHVDRAGPEPGVSEDAATLAGHFERALDGLIGGDAELGLPPCASRQARRQLELVSKAWVPLRLLLRQIPAPSETQEAFAYLGGLQKAGDGVLAEMEEAVKLLEGHYEGRARLLRTLLGLSVAAACGIGLLLAVTFRQTMGYRKRLDVVLARSEAKTRAIVDSAADGIITITEHGVIDSFNDAATRIFHYSADEVIGRNVSLLMPHPQRSGVGVAARHGGRGGPPHLRHDVEESVKREGPVGEANAWQPLAAGAQGEVIGRRKDGSTFPMDLNVSEVQLGPGRVLTAIVRDITERRQLEGEILGISRRVQQRIGRDLHDVMGQHLTGIAFLAKALQKKLTERALPEAENASQIAKMTNDAITQARAMSRGLCPVDLTADGLMASLSEYTTDVERVFGVECVFKCDQPVLVHDDDMATHLYHIVQEAVNNALKHGKAGRIEIGMAGSNGRCTLTVKDDGVGLPARMEPGAGLGLRIMDYRVKMIGATLDIRRDPGGGTVLACSFENARASGDNAWYSGQRPEDREENTDHV